MNQRHLERLRLALELIRDAEHACDEWNADLAEARDRLENVLVFEQMRSLP